MAHQICLRLPLLCMMIFSMIVGREQDIDRLFICGDMDCSGPISEAEGLNDFPALTEGKLAFRRQAKLQILGKPSDGSDYWIGKVGNKIGLVPSSLVREQRVLVKNPKYKQLFSQVLLVNQLNQEEEDNNSEEIENQDSLASQNESLTESSTADATVSTAEERIVKGFSMPITRNLIIPKTSGKYTLPLKTPVLDAQVNQHYAHTHHSHAHQDDHAHQQHEHNAKVEQSSEEVKQSILSAHHEIDNNDGEHENDDPAASQTESSNQNMSTSVPIPKEEEIVIKGEEELVKESVLDDEVNKHHDDEHYHHVHLPPHLEVATEDGKHTNLSIDEREENNTGKYEDEGSLALSSDVPSQYDIVNPVKQPCLDVPPVNPNQNHDRSHQHDHDHQHPHQIHEATEEMKQSIPSRDEVQQNKAGEHKNKKPHVSQIESNNENTSPEVPFSTKEDVGVKSQEEPIHDAQVEVDPQQQHRDEIHPGQDHAQPDHDYYNPDQVEVATEDPKESNSVGEDNAGELENEFPVVSQSDLPSRTQTASPDDPVSTVKALTQKVEEENPVVVKEPILDAQANQNDPTHQEHDHGHGHHAHAHQQHGRAHHHRHAHPDIEIQEVTEGVKQVENQNVPESGEKLQETEAEAETNAEGPSKSNPLLSSAAEEPYLAEIVLENELLPEHNHRHDLSAHHHEHDHHFHDELESEISDSDKGNSEMHVHPPKVNPLLEHTTTKDAKLKCDVHDHVSQTSQENSESSGYSLRDSFLVAVRHLSSTLLGFLPEHLQDTILDVNDAVVFTGIIALTLVSIFVPYFLMEAFLSVRPLKKKVTDLNKTLWKVTTAYENQQEEYDIFKEKAFAYDEDKKQFDQLEIQLYLVRQIETKLKTENRALKKKIYKDVHVAEELEALITATINERDQVICERDKLKLGIGSLQTKLQETMEQFEILGTEDASKQMDLKLLTHMNENLELRGNALEKEIGELRLKLNAEIELRRNLESQNEALTLETNSKSEELLDRKSVLHKYEETVNNLNDEISVKETELITLKESLAEDSPLVDIAEITGKLKMTVGHASSLQARVESITLENGNLTRHYAKAKHNLSVLQGEKDQAETRLSVLAAYFKEKEEELRRLVEKQEIEKEMRGKDKDELMQMIEEKTEAVKDLTERLAKSKQEFEETKLSHRNEIRALGAKSHETWLSLCQSERKAQETRKESELLRQKLTAIAKAKESEGHDSLGINREVPYSFAQLDMDDIPLPFPEEPTFPSYFGLGDFEPPLPLGDEEEDEIFALDNHLVRNGTAREPQRPPPLGQISPNYSDPDDDQPSDLSPNRGLGGRAEFSDGFSSLPPPVGERKGSYDNAQSRENYMNGPLTSSGPGRRRPISASSPYHALNL